MKVRQSDQGTKKCQPQQCPQQQKMSTRVIMTLSCNRVMINLGVFMMIMTSFRKGLDCSWYYRKAGQSKSFFRFLSGSNSSKLRWIRWGEREEPRGNDDRSIFWLKMKPLADKSDSEASLRRRRGAELLTSAETCKNEILRNVEQSAASRWRKVVLTLTCSPSLPWPASELVARVRGRVGRCH